MTALRRRRAVLVLMGGLAAVSLASAQACGFDGDGGLAPSAVTPPEAGGDVFASVPPEAAVPDASEAGPMCPPVAALGPDGGRAAFAVRRRAAAPADGGGTGDGGGLDAGSDADAGITLYADAGGDGGMEAGRPDTTAWRGCTSFVLDRSTAASESKDADGGTVQATARVFIEWDDAALYVAVDVDDAHVEGSSPELWLNDGFEIYASGFATVRTGDYMQFDHHYLIDHNGQAGDYSNVDVPVPYDGATAVATPTGYRIEARIDISALGGVLGAGETLWFDALLNDNDGITQSKFLVWAMQPHATCSCSKCSCNYSPAYDTLLFAPMELVP